MKIDDTQLKQIGTWFILVLGAFGTPFLELIKNLNVSPTWVIFLITTWYAIDYMLAVAIYHYFKVKKENVSWKIKSLYIGLGIGLLVIIGAFGPIAMEFFDTFGFSMIWIIFIGILYYSTEGLIIGFIVHYFKIPVPEIPEKTLILTEVKLENNESEANNTTPIEPNTTEQ